MGMACLLQTAPTATAFRATSYNPYPAICSGIVKDVVLQKHVQRGAWQAQEDLAIH